MNLGSGLPRYASSTDVARLAGVSQSAVSRAYRPGASISEETRRKVFEAAEKLGYRPSLIPQIMREHRSYLVAVVVGGLYNPFYAQVLEEFARRLQAVGNQVLLVHVNSGYSLDEAIPKLASYRVDAIVSALAVLSVEVAAALARLRIPVVAFNSAVRNEWVSTVSCANREAGATIAEHFVARGARTFGFITGPLDSPASEDRLAGYRDRLRDGGYPAPQVATGDFHYEGAAGALRTLGAGGLPDAIFCANDLTAMGAIDALRARGARIPQDVMIAGFDGIAAAAWGAYDLTTFEQDAASMVRRAVEIVTATTAMQRPAGEIAISLPPRLVERGSTRREPATPSTAPEN